MDFYYLDIPGFTQNKYAWAEVPDNANVSDRYDTCPKCGRAISLLHYNPPYNIEIKQPKKIGDFVNGLIPADLVVSERFVSEYSKSDLNGIKEFFELTIIKIGSKEHKNYTGSRLFGAMIEKPLTQVDYEKMQVKWDDKPQKGYCELCGPGGGGKGGILKSYDSISVIEDTWTGLDFFIPINFASNIMVTKKAKDFIEINKFENCRITIGKDAKFDFYIPNI